MKIQNDQWVLEIEKKGGRIKKLFYGNKKILGTFDRIDGKQGNTHVCIPNFGAQGEEYGLPFHGPARNLEWQVADKTDNKIKIDCEIKPTGEYPGNLLVEQTYIIENGLRQEITVKNIGQKSVPVCKK